MHIVSHGREGVIRKQLAGSKLLPLFAAVVAADSPALRQFGGDKGLYIASVLEAAGTCCFLFSWFLILGSWFLVLVSCFLVDGDSDGDDDDGDDERAGAAASVAGHRTGAAWRRLCARTHAGLGFDDAVFADDSEHNVEAARRRCRVVHVQRPCLQVDEMKAILAMCDHTSKGRSTTTDVMPAAAAAAAAATIATAANNSNDTWRQQDTAEEGGGAGVAATDDAGRPAAVRFVFLDYDSTLTRPVFLADINKWAISDNADVCARLTPAQLVEQFGGKERLALLRNWLGQLAALQVSERVSEWAVE